MDESSTPLEDKELEDIKKDEKVKRALSESAIATPKESPAAALTKEAPLLGITAIIFLGCVALYFL